MDRRNKISLASYFDNAYAPLSDAISGFHSFARTLKGELHFDGRWVYARTNQEAENNQGFDPVTEPEIYMEYLLNEDERNKREVGDFGNINDDYTLTLPHASPSPTDDPYNFRDMFHFRGGRAATRSDQLLFSNDRRRGPAFFNLAQWTRLTELIVAWRVPRYVWFDSYLYELEGRIHKHRAWGGWLGWFPYQIGVQDLPQGALAIPVGPGTLVASQQTQLQSEVPAQLEQAQQVELALVEMGVLPTQDDLIRPSPKPDPLQSP